MSVISKGQIAVRHLVGLLLVGGLIGVAAAQHENKSAPSAPASHGSSQAQHPSTSHPSTSRPSTPAHSNSGTRTGNTGTASHTTGTRTGTSTGARPNTRTTGTSNTNRPGTTGRNNSMGRPNTPGSSRPNTPGKAGAGTVSRTNTMPGRQVSLRGGGTANIRPNGQIRSINRNGMQINRGLNGSRRIESMHNGARVVSTGRGAGYVQRTYVVRGGHTYYSRTYYYHGAYRVGVYRGYYWHGYTYYGYYHPYWYHPVFYGWAYNPWPAPVYWGWGWGGAPWYGFYGGYFAPYPVYPSAAFWLTDYLIAANLQAAYAAQQAAAANAAAADSGPNNPPPDQQAQGGGDPQPSGSSQVTLSPEVKEAIAEEVKSQLAAQQAQAQQQGSSAPQQSASGAAQPAPTSGEVPPALNPARRTFVVDTDLSVNSGGQECQLTSGDVLTRLTDTPDSDGNVNASIQASKGQDCAAGKQITVSVNDLQEMQNHFDQQMDDGMKQLAAKQGTGGLPKAPDTSTVSSDVPAPAPDTSAGKAVDDQQAQGDQVESQVSKEAANGGS